MTGRRIGVLECVALTVWVPPAGAQECDRGCLARALEPDVPAAPGW